MDSHSASNHSASSTSSAHAASSTQASSSKSDHTFSTTRTREYPQQLWWAIACFIFLVGLFQYGSLVLNTVSRRRALARAQDPEHASRNRQPVSRLRRIPIAIVNVYRVIAFRWTFRVGSYTLNMAEVFVTCAYIIALFTWEFINTTSVAGQKFYISYWANRAGAIAASQATLVTVLGTKNNIVGYLTGISHEKLNYIHRMTARVVWVMLWVHGGARFSEMSDSDLATNWLRIGVAAVAGLSLLMIVSLRPIRSANYELFFFTHFCMAFLFLLGGYYHVKRFNYQSYIWPALMIWALDRALRLLRLVVFNHLYFWFSKSSALDATVELLSPSYVRVRLARPAHFHWNPAQMAYLNVPSVSRLPWEAHPFTISSVDTSRDAHATAVPDKTQLGDSSPYWKELVFLINVRSGFTKRLAAVAAEGKKVKIAIDGPYGESPDLKNDDTVVLIAGESGVTHTLSTFLGVVNDVRDGKSVCSKLIFIWSIRDAAQIDWISTTLCRALDVAPAGLSISIRIHVTGASSQSLPIREKPWDGKSMHTSDDTPKPSAAPSLLESPATQVLSGRPDLALLLREEVSATIGRMSVTVCASRGMANNVRTALRFPVSSPASIMRGEASVVLHVESFSYA